MHLLRITFTATCHDADRLAEALSVAGATAVTFEDAADQPVLEPLPGETRIWTRTQVSGLFEDGTDSSAVINRIRRIVGDQTLCAKIATLEDQKWERAWMDHFHPMRFGRRLWICPREQTPPEPEAVNILLDPGLAFGTGTHPTTALCLEWLDSHAVQDKTVIDYGCGSGILAIAAAKLGARHVWAVDHDPQALLATADNAEINKVRDILSLHEPATLPEIQTDILLANILAGPLIDLAPRLAARIRPGGDIVLSGILHDQAPEVMEKYQSWFNMAPVVRREEWVRLNGRRVGTTV